MMMDYNQNRSNMQVYRETQLFKSTDTLAVIYNIRKNVNYQLITGYEIEFKVK